MITHTHIYIYILYTVYIYYIIYTYIYIHLYILIISIWEKEKRSHQGPMKRQDKVNVGHFWLIWSPGHLFVSLGCDWSWLWLKRVIKEPKTSLLAYLSSGSLDLSTQIIQKSSTTKLQDHMCQTPPCRVWCSSIKCVRKRYMQSCTRCGFLGFLTEKTVFMAKVNDTTTFKVEDISFGGWAQPSQVWYPS